MEQITVPYSTENVENHHDLFDCLVFYAQSAMKIVMKFNKHFKFTQKKNAFSSVGLDQN